MTGMTKERWENLRHLRKGTDEALKHLADRARTHYESSFFEGVRNALWRTGVLLQPTGVLAKDKGFVVLGQQVTRYKVITRGRQKKVLSQKRITLPIDLLFRGPKITFEGASTYWHEVVHAAPKGHLMEVVRDVGFRERRAAEEVIADIGAINIARAMKFSPRFIVEKTMNRVPYYRDMSKTFLRLLFAASGLTEEQRRLARDLHRRPQRKTPKLINTIIEAFWPAARKPKQPNYLLPPKRRSHAHA